jgi:hypothetical protein
MRILLTPQPRRAAESGRRRWTIYVHWRAALLPLPMRFTVGSWVEFSLASANPTRAKRLDCCSVFQTPFTILSGPETKGLACRTLTTPKGFGIS